MTRSATRNVTYKKQSKKLGSKKSNQYLKLVEWSEEDQCYIGRAPELMLGGVHGTDETKVYAQLCKAVDEWIKIHESDDVPLPPPHFQKDYSGKFVLRVGKTLHEQLAIRALKEEESINAFCVDVLKRALRR